jgi:hypothetical protein
MSAVFLVRMRILGPRRVLGVDRQGRESRGKPARARWRPDLEQGSAGKSWRGKFGGQERGSTAVDRERGGTEQVLKWPTRGQMNTHAAGCLADAGAEFEQLGAQGFDLRRTPGLGQVLAEEVDQVISGPMQQ